MSATPSGTRGYFERIKDLMATQGISLRSMPLGNTDLHVSRVGFGSYRIHEFETEHREALKHALLSGCNLIDTSSNYTDGSSERLIGEVTAELIEQGKIKREEIVFVTKAGYVQGANMAKAKARTQRGESYPEMVEFQPDCWHNISPQFLQDQITTSLQNLRINTIDVLLLHNPEYFLKSGGSREAYYQRIEKAFRHLETERINGRIKYYGISSNTFPEPESRSDFTNLAKVIEIAQSVAKPHHFAVIQCPFNLFESGAALTPNNQRETVLDFAAKNKLGVLTNRPFNSLQKGRLIRLTSFPKHDPVEIKGGLHTTLGRAIELEKAAGFPKSAQGLQWAHLLRDRIGDLDDILTWREVLYGQILPSIRQSLSRLGREHQVWSDEYQNVMRELLQLVTFDLENLANEKSKVIEDQLDQGASELSSSQSLSQKMIRIYTALPQISSVLIGMRKPEYVDDILHSGPPLPQAKSVSLLSRFQRHRS